MNAYISTVHMYNFVRGVDGFNWINEIQTQPSVNWFNLQNQKQSFLVRSLYSLTCMLISQKLKKNLSVIHAWNNENTIFMVKKQFFIYLNVMLRKCLQTFKKNGRTKSRNYKGRYVNQCPPPLDCTRQKLASDRD